MPVCLTECQICGEQNTGTTKTNFRSRTKIYKNTLRKSMSKEAVPKQALKYYCSDRHNDKEIGL